MAELLVKVSKHWMDDLAQADVDKLSEAKKEHYNARTQIGDIVVVKRDGWPWGREEGLPNFIVVKLPGVDVKTVEHFIEPLMDTSIPDKPKMLRRKKYRIPENWTKSKASLGNGVIILNLSAEKQALIASIVEKTS
jgi:hypothetical protein